MARVLGSMGFWIIIYIHLMSLVLAQEGIQFLHYDFSKADLYCDGMANTDEGPLHLTNNTDTSTGHAFYKVPMNFTTSSSFSTEFVFAILPVQSPPVYGHGMAFVVSPFMDLRSRSAANSYLGLFNFLTNNKTESHILAVELDTNKGAEANDKSDNHVGIDINSIYSVEYANASYFDDTERQNKSLLLASGESMVIWIDYDGVEKLLNVTLAPVPKGPDSPLLSSSIKPSVPLLSRSINLPDIFNETMFVGFSGSTGSVKSNQYILGWSFSKGGKAQSLDISRISNPPPSSPPPPSPSSPSPSDAKESSLKVIIGATISTIVFLIILLGGIVYLYKKNKYAEVLGGR